MSISSVSELISFMNFESTLSLFGQLFFQKCPFALYFTLTISLTLILHFHGIPDQPPIT